MFKVFGFLFLIIPAMSFGSCWIDVYSDKQTDIYLDACSIVQVGKYKKAWLRWVIADAEDTSTYPTKKYDETRNLTYFDCASRSSATINIIYYSPEPENKAVDSWSKQFKNTDLVDVTPDTLGEAVLNAACRMRRSK